MKTIIAAAAFTLAAASPVFAAKTTIEFVPDDGSAAGTWVFDDATMTATGPDGSVGPYTYDQATATICGTDPGGNEVCATFTDTETEPAVGVSSAYTMNTGDTGTATIKAID
ncbi:MAG: hypothetical protein AAF253_05410 [Pseudomonadota bacterium]